MPTTLQAAIDSLYAAAVTQRASQSPARLKLLSQYCIEQLEARGLVGVASEQVVPGGGRPKVWDVAWQYDGKYRLAISLKSLLKNLAGTVPNRLDDLMGEAANASIALSRDRNWIHHDLGHRRRRSFGEVVLRQF